MRRVLSAALAVTVLMIVPLSARALVARPMTTPEKAVAADVVVTGKVLNLEEKPVEALPFPGAADKVAYTVATLKIDDALAGAKGVTHLRVGFVLAAPGGTGGVPRPAGARPFNPNLVAGQEGCFFLVR